MGVGGLKSAQRHYGPGSYFRPPPSPAANTRRNPRSAEPPSKAELKRQKLTYADLAERLKEHGLPEESETTIKAKLKRGAFAATFLLATLAAMEMEGMRLEDF